MPPTDKPFYNTNLLHLLFAVASVVLLGVTVWMIVADHRREWKEYQRTYREDIAPWLTAAELREKEIAESQGAEEHQREKERLEHALRRQEPTAARDVFQSPFLDALGGPLAVQQYWLPELTVDYHFRDVARFDRCTTCHFGIDQSRPGMPGEPAVPAPQTLHVQLKVPVERVEELRESEKSKPTVSDVYGFEWAERGILDPAVPTVGLVLPRSVAAMGLLEAGDVLAKVNGTEVDTSDTANRLLLAAVDSETAELDEYEENVLVNVAIRRGLAAPYCSHPRLDLFVGALSPHPASEFGCTICHDGQGTATSFKWASHTPNDPAEAAAWRKEHAWARNPHWDLPMTPRRFSESRCLRCHHGVVELEASREYPDAPAPNLVAGYQLVRENGCFGCHEIKGTASGGRSVGPDMRLEPNYAEAAMGLLATDELNQQQNSLAERLVREPYNSKLRQRLVDSLEQEKTPEIKRLAGVLREGKTWPEAMHKVGPSLRDTPTRLSKRFLAAWTGAPSDFRPATRMPAFFGMHSHITGKALEQARRYEPIELAAMAEYIRTAGRNVEPLPLPEEKPSIEKGKTLFESQGCLACHTHDDFDEIAGTQGPDLSRLGAKYTDEIGRRWLIDWIRDPGRHAPRSIMPNPRLTAAQAVDIAEYLLRSNDWACPELPPLDEKALDELALSYLAASVPEADAARYLKEGVSESERANSALDELIGPPTVEKKLCYVGRRTIARRGCYGCHDIPGFEAAPLIGPALSAWGRKQESLLAFEQVDEYLATQEQDHPGETAEAKSQREFFEEAIRGKRRAGFFWQKLHAPRSFDYEVAEGKKYPEHLKMGRFDLSDEQIEQIAVFVLGLTADAPAEKFVYNPPREKKAELEGRRLLTKYACTQCHTTEMERWTFDYDPEEFERPIAAPQFEFMRPHFSEQQVAASKRVDRRGLGRARVIGMPAVDEDGQLLEDEDDDGNPLYFVTPWQPALIDGDVWTAGGVGVPIAKPQIVRREPYDGGVFARWLYPRVVQEALASGASSSVTEAFGWLPPPLMSEGGKVRTQWLYQYLLDPATIRPAAVLNMPRYRLCPQEAARLTDYFAAVSGAEFPYHDDAPPAILATESQKQQTTGALEVLTDSKTFCAKCHLVGDYRPGGKITTILAPNLADVHSRLRADYLRRWLADPKQALPYTAMPVNFPPQGELLGQDLLPGTSLEQIDAMTELLLNYAEIMAEKTSIREMAEGE